ncbi:hypothetical protein ACLQ3J_17315, partial [Rhodococcus sp. DT1]
MGRLFGTDGVRGLANAELTVELALRLAGGAAAVLAPVDSGRRRAGGGGRPGPTASGVSRAAPRPPRRTP